MSESDLHLKNKTVRHIKQTIETCAMPDDIKICFVLSYPRSDMGKGTLVAQLLAGLDDADVIKFDGLLNTNKSGRHTTPGHDDFGTYEQFNPGRTWGADHYILGGELYKNFIDTYGENENLRIKQHLSLYLEMTICTMWAAIGKPQVLFVEVGGVLTDPEVDPIFTPFIQRMQRVRDTTEVILLTESGYNGEYIKTKSIQDGVTMLLSHSITPTIVVVREPEVFMDDSNELARIERERAIINRIEDNLGLTLYTVVSVPNFAADHMASYTSFAKKRIVPYLQPAGYDQKKVLIGTSNRAKYGDFIAYLGNDYELVMPNARIDIPEGMHSLEENAAAKARAWCIMTGLPAIADDTGFFIRALNGEPGVAVRRWAGELPETATQEQFWDLLKHKTANLEDMSAYVEQCVAIAFPNGKVRIVRNRANGYIDKDKLDLPYNGSGYPLAAAFVATERTKSWDEMSADEKRAFDAAFISDLKAALRTYFG
ncbi:MAG TPA: non-canonical purine NTP pyrophosphatase [Candidatus Saccharimonadales bacterium]|nr:non-canonical purine NTP pyrophosphatase [Candidatus Saccharimonadales bacterium]